MSRWRTYAELVRLPNVFTALADICLGWLAALATGTPPARWPAFVLLLAASACLYAAGMVWNDFFDVEQDRRERPHRPLPSGRISRRTAAAIGTFLLLAGLLLAAGAGGHAGAWTQGPLVIAGCLAAAILLYDGVLKPTWAGPLAMGSCRALNVLLGLTLVEPGTWGWPVRLHLALAVGIYIVGVTWFARREAATSTPAALAGAAGVMLAGLLLALALPVWFPPGTSSWLFPYLLVALGLLVGIPALRAITRPSPVHVQRAVKRAILGLVVLDAVLATGLAGVAGLLILLLLLPALYLGRWIYST